jgi:carbonic anhydrase
MPFSQQSPINLHDPIYAELGDKGLNIGWTGKVTGLVVKEKDGAKVQFFPGNPQPIRLGGHDYVLNSFHFHHPSEHMLDGRPYAMELHLVHLRVTDGTLIAVISVLVELGDQTSHPDVDAFLKEVAQILNPPPGQHAAPHIKIDPRIFLPERPEEYYRYEGSLTTPEFTENVSWVVLRNPLRVSREELGDLIA